jgi:hypothetical protein
MNSLRSTGACLICAVLSWSAACTPGVSDEGATDEETDVETAGDGDGDSGDGDGDGDSGDGDGDGDSGDGDGDSGDGDGDSGDGDGDGDPMAPVCMDGCVHIQACAPDAFTGLYADIPECVSACLDLWSACEPEGSAYVYCTLGLDCASVMTLMTEGPAQTECGGSYDNAQAACMNP